MSQMRFAYSLLATIAVHAAMGKLQKIYVEPTMLFALATAHAAAM